METWVSDAAGDPVLVVMAAPGASLAMELRRLLPDLRRAVGDDRRVLVGFDRGGWSPALFEHMDAQGFDVLTWRKGSAEDVDPTLFTDAAYTDQTGRTHQWRVADTTVDLSTGDDHVFTMRQVSLLVANNKTGREQHPAASTRQIHILTTRGDLPVEQVIYRMGSRWRQENYFRYARMHFDLERPPTSPGSSSERKVRPHCRGAGRPERRRAAGGDQDVAGAGRVPLGLLRLGPRRTLRSGRAPGPCSAPCSALLTARGPELHVLTCPTETMVGRFGATEPRL
jgi:hypothetical protein